MPHLRLWRPLTDNPDYSSPTRKAREIVAIPSLALQASMRGAFAVQTQAFTVTPVPTKTAETLVLFVDRVL